MARADSVTKLPLDRWATIMGVNPLHFNGVFVGEPTVCEQPWLQYAWMAANRVGRDEVAQAILQAEADIEQYLGYHLIPAWETDEWQGTIRGPRPELINVSSLTLRGFSQMVPTDWKQFVSGGIRSKEVISAGAAIVYSDDDGDGYSETATVTVTPATSIATCEVHIYYPGHSAADEWEVRPVAVSASGGTYTITFRREQVVLESAIDDLVPDAADDILRGVDGTDAGNFQTTVDVYRVYNDPQQQVTMLWEPFGLGCTDCAGTGCTTCAYNQQAGCLMLRGDPRWGMAAYRPATWNSTTLEFDAATLTVRREPDLVRLWYYAGYRNKSYACPTLHMDARLERAVAGYAAALLARPICECANVQSRVKRFQQDLRQAVEGQKAPALSAADLRNPFGTTQGAIDAWHMVQMTGRATGRAALV